MLPRTNNTFDLDPFTDKTLQRALWRSDSTRKNARNDDAASIKANLYDAFLTLVTTLRAVAFVLFTNLRRLAYTLALFVQQARRNPSAYRSIAWKSAKRRLWSVTTWLIVIWIVVLYWGEVKVFKNAVEACSWERWERWPATATPHYLTLITDPQLVDPHTYPSRPWPLSTLTILHTDLYLHRAYSRIQTRLDPHSVVFLGDLFDGGREWGTRESSSPDERWRGYGRAYWLDELQRFWRIFGRESARSHLSRSSRQLDQGGTSSTDGRMESEDADTSGSNRNLEQSQRRDGRQILASLPGNHDLGFGRGIQLPVRQRFQAYFGESNRLDVIGNHTFVSIDSVSLSAKDQRGSEVNEAIWRPAWDFLEQVQKLKRREEERWLRWLWDEGSSGLDDRSALDPAIYDLKNATDLAVAEKMSTRSEPSDRLAHHLSSLAGRQSNQDLATYADSDTAQQHSDSLLARDSSLNAGLPRILLTHVPLYRPANTPCGPLRERGTSIPISAGYQYQNTLTPYLTDHILEKLTFDLDGPSGGGNLINVFSGDDHDYCDHIHTASDALRQKGKDEAHPEWEGLFAQLRIREITVKSISWAMGVRRPGFLLVSLWNPVDELGYPLPRPPQLRRARPLSDTPAKRALGDPEDPGTAAAAREEEAEREREATLQTHLCLLPDELSILVRYGILLGISLLTLLVRAVFTVLRSESSVQDEEVSLLPSYRPNKAKVEPDADDMKGANGMERGYPTRRDSKSWRYSHQLENGYDNGAYPYPTGTTSSTAEKPTGTRRPRGYSTPLQRDAFNLGILPIERHGGSGTPFTNPNGLVQSAGYTSPHAGAIAQAPTAYSPISTKKKEKRSDGSRIWVSKSTGAKRRRQGCRGILVEFGISLRLVAGIVLAWYLVLWNFW